jgi:hypothetical protein
MPARRRFLGEGCKSAPCRANGLDRCGGRAWRKDGFSSSPSSIATSSSPSIFGCRAKNLEMGCRPGHALNNFAENERRCKHGSNCPVSAEGRYARRLTMSPASSLARDSRSKSPFLRDTEVWEEDGFEVMPLRCRGLICISKFSLPLGTGRRNARLEGF